MNRVSSRLFVVLVLIAVTVLPMGAWNLVDATSRHHRSDHGISTAQNSITVKVRKPKEKRNGYFVAKAVVSTSRDIEVDIGIGYRNDPTTRDGMNIYDIRPGSWTIRSRKVFPPECISLNTRVSVYTGTTRQDYNSGYVPGRANC